MSKDHFIMFKTTKGVWHAFPVGCISNVYQADGGDTVERSAKSIVGNIYAVMGYPDERQ